MVYNEERQVSKRYIAYEALNALKLPNQLTLCFRVDYF
jgi:hypothetical protein